MSTNIAQIARDLFGDVQASTRRAEAPARRAVEDLMQQLDNGESLDDAISTVRKMNAEGLEELTDRMTFAAWDEGGPF